MSIFKDQCFCFNLLMEGQNSKIFLLNFFITLVFQRIKDLNRLDRYIINSFQILIDSEVINRQKKEMEDLYKELEALSRIDVLTNVLNRRAFFEAMEAEKSRTLRSIWRFSSKSKKEIINTKPLGSLLDHYGKFSCMMIDVDFFKRINDTYGHLAGDGVLKKLGELLNSTIFRDNDIIGRYGGEEFAAILPETNAKNVKIPAERLREKINRTEFKSGGEVFHISVSIGISEFRIDDKKTEDVINRADKALYYAKKNGKNITVIYEDVFDD